MEESLIIAPAGRLVKRCVVVSTSQVVCVQQRDYRFLAYRCKERPFLEWEDHRIGRAQVQILIIEILPVRWSVGIHYAQIFEIENHHGFAELTGSRIIRTVGSLEVNAFR